MSQLVGILNVSASGMQLKQSEFKYKEIPASKSWSISTTQPPAYGLRVDIRVQPLGPLPGDVIVPNTLVVSARSGQEILDRIVNPARPTPAMEKLFAGSSSTTAGNAKD